MNVIYQAPEATIDQITAEDLEETLRDTKETAARLDQWVPADLKMWSKNTAATRGTSKRHAKTGKWPTQMHTARAAFLPKDEDPLEPQSYKVLLMLTTVYRL